MQKIKLNNIINCFKRKEFSFVLEYQDENITFQCESEQERDDWFYSINQQRGHQQEKNTSLLVIKKSIPRVLPMIGQQAIDEQVESLFDAYYEIKDIQLKEEQTQLKNQFEHFLKKIE